MIIAWLSILLLQAATPPPITPAAVNLDLEQVDASGRPAGWLQIPAVGPSSFFLGSAPGETGGRSGRIAHSPSPPAEAAPYGGMLQRIDAAPWRGRLVRLSARIRAIRPGLHAGLSLRVLRPGPKSAGFQDSMADHPIVADEWRRYEIRGRVAPEAEAIEIAIVARGDAEILFDDVSIEAVEPDPTGPSAEAAAYLDTAIGHLRRLHIDSPTADWDRIVADAHAEIGGARTPADTYNAIRGVFGALGEKHTFMIPPRREPPAIAAPGASRAAPAIDLPRYRLTGGRYGMVRIPAFIGTADESRLYAGTLRRAFQILDAQRVCGWIVDLRGNGGGNMWPMLTGLDPLLGAPPFGSFVVPSAPAEFWVRRGGSIMPATASGRARPYFELRAAALPLAVLIDRRTASSGEMTAIALIGRENVRTFGETSAGYTTANQLVDLPDGAKIAVTSAFVRDREGRDYRDVIVPDEAAPDALAAALRWLAAQPCRT